MKGSLSVLSAAVLMALAASGSDSNTANAASLNALHSSHPGTAGKNTNGIPLIRKHARGAKGAALGSKKKSAQVRLPSLRHSRINAPNGGGSVLYDQLQTPTTDALVALNCSSISGCSSLSGLDSDSADDFVVSAGGWTVSGFNFLTTNFYSTLVTETADVFIYPDNGSGAPSDTATCSSPASTNNPTDNGDGSTLAGITLNDTCALDPGTYWVSVAFNDAGGDFNWPFYWFHSEPVTGAEGMFRNPDDGFGTGCTDWSPANGCSPSTSGNPYDFAFQVLGTAGGGGGGDGITLALTLAEDDGTGNVCGTGTTLTANLGDQVDLCYTVTNDSDEALNYHSLTDSLAGQIFSLTPVDLEPGASFSYIRTITASSANEGNITAIWTAQEGAPGYQNDTTGASQFVDISTTGTDLGLSDDGEASVSVPFSFNFYGTTSNLLTVGNNGAVRVGTGTGSVGFTNTALPEAGSPPPTMYPLWDDFDDESGGVYTAVTGTSPNQKFYIEWFDRPHFNGTDNTDTATFELVIDEASGNFSFEYDDVAYTNTAGGTDPTDCTGGLCATIGLQSDDTLFNQFSFDTASVTDGLSIAWSPSDVGDVFTDSATATLDVVAPVITVDPASLEATVPSAGTGSSTLTVGNTGDADLDFTVDEAPHTGAGFPAISHPYVRGQRDPNKTATQRPTRLTGKDGKPLFHNFGPRPNGGMTVPSFADNPLGGDFVSLDATAPGTINSVGPLATDPLPLGGTFINNDFTTEYVITYSPSSGTGALATIDTASGAITEVGPITGAAGVVIGLTWDPTSGTLYTTDATTLYAVDPTTGAVTTAATLDGVNLAAIAADSAGNIYGLDFNTASIVAIDKTTGASQQVVALPISPNYAQDMDVDLATNTLYYASYDKYGGEMYSVDLDTAAITDVGPLGDGSAELTAFAVAVSGSDCSSPADVPWLSETPTSGTVAPGADTPVTVNYDASTLADGTYTANVCVRSNDTTNATVDVPVTLTVGNGGGGDDIIFQDGFDGTGGGGGTPVAFSEDDGSFENSIGLNNQATESAAVWINRFTLGAGQFPLTLSDVQIEWPDATTAGGDLTGLAVNILVYYDADGDGDPSNAVKEFEGPATIDTLSAFQTYPVSATIPGGGDIYVGFENSYAEGGASPGLLFPAAIDQDSGSAHNSYVSAMSSGDPDVDNLGNNGLTGVIDDLASSLAGNWLIRADGQTSAGAPVVLK